MTDDHGAPLDVPTLTLLARRADAHPLVDGWTFRPDSVSPRRLELRLDAGQYPSAVEVAKVDVRWFENGDYTFHYVERRGNDRWQCRWDRHPEPGSPREHFHPPPDAASTVEPSGLDASHHLGVLFAVIDRVEDRIRTLHGA